MEKSYIEYAMSVIVGRALPDVRDGLKPVHRRILYAMYEDGLTRDKPFRKCATAVGDVLGRYHPHGDASVYDALVRHGAGLLACAIPLIDGHGNFGSVDGDPPAAYRYTEARMSQACADEMLRDIDKDTVDWDPNFDETRKEPRVLPEPLPESAGQRLLRHRRRHGDEHPAAQPARGHRRGDRACSTTRTRRSTDLMRPHQRPGLPDEGHHHGPQPASAPPTPRAAARSPSARAPSSKSTDRTVSASSSTELPYQVNKRMLIKNIAEQVKDKRLEGISDLRDESDRNGMRIVIELKRDANPQVVLNQPLCPDAAAKHVLHHQCWRSSITSASRRSSPCATFSTSI